MRCSNGAKHQVRDLESYYEKYKKKVCFIMKLLAQIKLEYGVCSYL